MRSYRGCCFVLTNLWDYSKISVRRCPMEKEFEYSLLPGAVLNWYDSHKRDLPWRVDREPYHVWLSEIMLQQTRVEAVKGYYSRFLNKLPTIEALANADDALLHKLWEGLGYYSRVRNLKKAAEKIMNVHCGIFPGEYTEVLALPGIGPYTAGAICSICFDQSTPAVDGNVLRLMTRLLDDHSNIDETTTKKKIAQILRDIYPARAGDFTQGLMELGATVCGPNTVPDCSACPCNHFCLGYRNGTASSLPVRSSKKQRRMEKKTVLIFSCEGKYALCKRPDQGLLASMWQFPELDGWFDLDAVIEQVEKNGIRIAEIIKQVERKHVFTHIEWHMRGVYMEVRTCAPGYTWMDAEQIRQEAALPTAYRLFFDELN